MQIRDDEQRAEDEAVRRQGAADHREYLESQNGAESAPTAPQKRSYTLRAEKIISYVVVVEAESPEEALAELEGIFQSPDFEDAYEGSTDWSTEYQDEEGNDID